jgi:hypothetical protein
VKALPLWQPWASLVAVEAKRVETRHWPCPRSLIGKRIAIHATKTKNELWVCATEPFLTRLRQAHDAGTLVFVEGELPLGAIVATVTVDQCCEMTADSIAALRASDPDEHAFGNYQPGRFAWVLRDVERLAEPVPWKGSQGIFEVPNEALGLPAEPRNEQAALL